MTQSGIGPIGKTDQSRRVLGVNPLGDELALFASGVDTGAKSGRMLHRQALRAPATGRVLSVAGMFRTLGAVAIVAGVLHVI
jgi:hypothetical protein